MAHSPLWLAALALCVSCGGSSFGSSGTGGASGSAAGGSTSSGGTTGASGTTGVSGSTSTAGAPGGGAVGSSGTGGASAGSGGSTSSGGSSGTAGSGGAADCVMLRADYEAAAEKARGCDSGSTDECSKSSTLPAVGCGCAILVNAKSPFLPAAEEKYKAFQAAKCGGGLVCNIACLPYTEASCTAQMTATGTAFQCTGTQGGIAN